jgi:DNA-binding NarL/FixJ family response regulator
MSVTNINTQAPVTPSRLLVVEDDTNVRDFCVRLLRMNGYQVVAAENGRVALDRLGENQFDLVFTDLQMPEMNGLDAMIAIRGEFPDARIIVLTTYTGDVQARRALQAGARAYLLKNSLHKELLDTIRAVHAGRKNLSAEVSFELAEHAAEETLSPLEVRVLRQIAEGNSNKEIAAQLSVTEDAVKGQVRNILAKLGANDRTHAVTIAVKRGIIEL